MQGRVLTKITVGEKRINTDSCFVPVSQMTTNGVVDIKVPEVLEDLPHWLLSITRTVSLPLGASNVVTSLSA